MSSTCRNLFTVVVELKSMDGFMEKDFHKSSARPVSDCRMRY